MVPGNRKNRALFLSLIQFLFFILSLWLFQGTAVAQGPPQFISVSTEGTASNEEGRAIVSTGTDLLVGGVMGSQGLVVQYGIPPGPSLATITLPGNTYFSAVALSSNALFAAGGALPPDCSASDGVGGTEHKSALAWYNQDATLGGCVSPNFFSYRSGEGFGAVATGYLHRFK